MKEFKETQSPMQDNPQENILSMPANESVQAEKTPLIMNIEGLDQAASASAHEVSEARTKPTLSIEAEQDTEVEAFSKKLAQQPLMMEEESLPEAAAPADETPAAKPNLSIEKERDTKVESFAKLLAQKPLVMEGGEPLSEKPAAPAGKPKEPATSVSIEDIARMIAVKTNEVKEPTLTRAALDDETLLSEIYALIGGPTEKKQPLQPQPAEKPEAASKPEQPALKMETAPQPEQPAHKPIEVPAAAKDPKYQVESLHLPPIVMEGYDNDLNHPDLSEGGTPGWLKGMFLLLISLLLSGMTLYAVATDVMGKIF